MRPYDLRHSFASPLFVEGINPVEIAEQLGHSLQMLLSTYTHVIEELRGGERHSAEALIKQAREEMLTKLTQSPQSGDHWRSLVSTIAL
jgi:integrase